MITLQQIISVCFSKTNCDLLGHSKESFNELANFSMTLVKHQSELEGKMLKIQLWLGSLSGDLQNEPYEIDEFTVDYLYQLCQVF